MTERCLGWREGLTDCPTGWGHLPNSRATHSQGSFPPLAHHLSISFPVAHIPCPGCPFSKLPKTWTELQLLGGSHTIQVSAVPTGAHSLLACACWGAGGLVPRLGWWRGLVEGAVTFTTSTNSRSTGSMLPPIPCRGRAWRGINRADIWALPKPLCSALPLSGSGELGWPDSSVSG